MENKNQWHERVLFRADIPGGALFVEKDRFTYAFAHQLQKQPFFNITIIIPLDLRECPLFLRKWIAMLYP